MSDLFDDPAPPASGANAPEMTVSELSAGVKRTIEGAYDHVRVRGEVGRVSRPRSGHLYLDLKDDSAVLAAICWKGAAQRLKIQPEEGMEVIATGRLTTFPGQSRYQLIIESLEPAGVGALMAQLDARRRALAAEGVFDAARKQAIPFLPTVIGVVTSPSGAVIRDILHRLADRFPRRVLVWPVAVQGDRCAAEVAAAIKGFNALPVGGPIPRPDVLIVARGGGSLEDLWGFNEEIVVRAAAESRIPLISAVGHETDTTLIDLAADMRAPTPTAAAEIAVPVRADLLAALAGLDERRLRAAARGLSDRRVRLRDLARGLPRADQLLADRVQRLDALTDRLPRALAAFAAVKRADMGRGPAARFAPGLLSGSLARRRDRLEDRAARLRPALTRMTVRAAERLAAAAIRLRPARITTDIARARASALALGGRLDRAGALALKAARDRLSAAARLLDGLSHKATLARGFAIVRLDGGGVVTAATGAPEGASITLEFGAGPRLAAQSRGPQGDEPEAAASKHKRRAAPKKSGPRGQGSLF
jgi:exodeoxyribonuclease VII large subunit